MGGHLSTSSGIEKTPERALDFNFKSFQIFSKNQMQWKAKPLNDDVIMEFRKKKKETGVQTMIHASYLLNTASSDPELRKKVMEAFSIEIDRGDQLNADLLTFHPGSFKEATLEKGLENVVAVLNEVLRKDQNIIVLIENSAGQGNSVGKTFQDISRIIDEINYKDKVGVCLDTCHAWAAGYNIKDKNGYEHMMQEIKDTVGIEKIKGFHLNDSKKGLGEATDRHEQIGKGTMGIEGFRNLINDDQFTRIPMILETPLGEDGYIDDLMALENLFK